MTVGDRDSEALAMWRAEAELLFREGRAIRERQTRSYSLVFTLLGGGVAVGLAHDFDAVLLGVPTVLAIVLATGLQAANEARAMAAHRCQIEEWIETELGQPGMVFETYVAPDFADKCVGLLLPSTYLAAYGIALVAGLIEAWSLGVLAVIGFAVPTLLSFAALGAAVVRLQTPLKPDGRRRSLIRRVRQTSV